VAKQNPHPKSWFLTDGCTGVLDFTKAIKRACDIHDTDYHWGGPTAEIKLAADTEFYKNLSDAGWLGHFLAPIRYRGVRRATWNEPPRKDLLGHQDRYDTMFQALKHGQSRIEAWNWKGPGRGKHANMQAQNYLLPEQKRPAEAGSVLI